MTVAEVACWAEAGAALAKRAVRPARVVVNFIVVMVFWCSELGYCVILDVLFSVLCWMMSFVLVEHEKANYLYFFPSCPFLLDIPLFLTLFFDSFV